jgi:hypothetical protein
MEDSELLDACPDFISLGSMMKATPSTEDGRRFLFLEASNEDRDHEGEVVLQKALTDSADYFKRHGNIDLSHFTILGPKHGIKDYMHYEIGRPVEVRVSGPSTFVKCELYKGESPMAKNANLVWESITKQDPPMRWYPSVGGAVLAKSIRLDPISGDKVAVIEKVRWNNIALDRTPVNKSVSEVSLAPLGTFAKSLGGFIVAKALEASHVTDVAKLTGGAALGMQSIDRKLSSYFDFRERLAKHMRSGDIGKNPGAAELVRFSEKKFGLSPSDAAEWVEKFMGNLKSDLTRRS